MVKLLWIAAALAACGGDSAGSLPDAAMGTVDAPPVGTTDVVVDFDLDDNLVPPELNIGDGALAPTEGYAPLGPDGNQFGDLFLRSRTGNTVTLTVPNLPAHSKISIAFLFAAIDSLDGTGSFPAGDYMRIDLDGTPVFRESFANALPEQEQSYVPSDPDVVLARRVDLGFQGPGGYFTDSAYNMAKEAKFQNLPHTSSTAVIAFTLEGEGVQSVDDESWAVDNLRVRIVE